VNQNNQEVYVTTIQRRVPAWAGLERTRNGMLRARVSLPKGVSPLEVEAEFGYSTKSTNPLLSSQGWRYAPLRHARFDRASGHDHFEAPIPSIREATFAVARFRFPGQTRWIYADSSEQNRKGNYDGISPDNFVQISPIRL
jgi:hypothetical protein